MSLQRRAFLGASMALAGCAPAGDALAGDPVVGGAPVAWAAVAWAVSGIARPIHNGKAIKSARVAAPRAA